MDWFLDFVTNPFLIASISSWLIAQVMKMILYSIMNKKLDFGWMISDGGMPSCHSATVSSLALFSALSCGTGSFEFAVTLILAIIVCNDAMGVRREAGKQAVILNEIIKAFEVFETEKLPEVKLKEFVGHTPIQVLAGITVGIVNALLMFLLIF